MHILEIARLKKKKNKRKSELAKSEWHKFHKAHINFSQDSWNKKLKRKNNHNNKRKIAYSYA